MANVFFYTNGEYFTNLMNDLLKSGEFLKIKQTFDDSGADKMLKPFLLGEAEFKGDTRNDDFTIEHIKRKDPDGESFLWTGIKSRLDVIGDERESLGKRMEEFYLWELNRVKDDSDIQTLLRIFTLDELKGLLWKEALQDYDSELIPKFRKPGKIRDGVILSNGWSVEGYYMCHNNLMYALHELGMVDNSDWSECNDSVHISSGTLSGNIIHTLESPNTHQKRYKLVTKELIDTLFFYRKELETYANDERIPKILREGHEEYLNKGTKYANLSFLRKYYNFLDVKYPVISLDMLDINSGKVFVRTSPKRSIPGLLNSICVNNDDKEVEGAINKILAEFDKFKEVRKETYMGGKISYNEIHYFFQEFIDGSNGVAHYVSNEFRYALSKTQGDVVKGIESNEVLSDSHHKILSNFCKELSFDLSSDIQVEFIISGDDVYIVQLRELHNPPSYIPYNIDESEILKRGISFSRGKGKFHLADVLVVEKDANSEDLLNKEALIVRSDTSEFSHILALSKALGIPSLYGIGDFELPEKFQLQTHAKEAYILKW